VRNIKLVVEYDGTDFFGFQRQPGRRTVQGTLEWALSRIMKEPVSIVGAGRTDAGVHALGQVVSFRAGGSIPTDRISIAVNSVLPRDVVAKETQEAPEDFHARYSAVSRVYRYTILESQYPSALCGRYVWWRQPWLDLDAMRQAARALVGKKDFASFALADTEDRTTVRELSRLSIERSGDRIVFEFEADAFLRGMVRSIVGTLVEVGEGRRSPEDVEQILLSRDRSAAGMTAPARGLCLVGVRY